MNLKLDKKSGFYLAIVRTVNGRTRTINTRQTNRRDAINVIREAKIEEIERAAMIGLLTNEAISLIQSDKKITLSFAMNAWLEWMKIGLRPITAAGYELIVRKWLAGVDMENSSPRIVEEKHVHNWINDKDWSAKESSRRGQLAAIKSFCQFCVNENYMGKDPSERVLVSTDTLTHAQKEPKARTIFSDEEIEKLLAEFKPGGFWHAAVALGRYAGLRIGDVCRLEWDSFQTPGVLMVWTHKRHRPVKVPIHEKLAQAMQAIPTREDTFIFPKQRDVVSDIKRRSALSHMFTRTCQRLGIQGRSFHDLRRTFCTVQSKKGMSAQEIGKLVGHSREATTEIYIQKSEPGESESRSTSDTWQI